MNLKIRLELIKPASTDFGKDACLISLPIRRTSQASGETNHGSKL
ncbi:MAG: hypothetical protein O3B04_06355 [Chloroflexi bacterium]|nr:hypothetical protein [Chloroflexota bacterium]MDA1297608.1 hypothetical protein [Chloroflexota bacterium]